MSLTKYRFLDLLFFTVITGIIDIIMLIIITNSITVRLYISISIPMLFLVYVRWRKYGVITNICLAVIHFLGFMFIGGFNLENLFAGLGNGLSILCVALVLIPIYWLKQRERKFSFLTLSGCFLACYLCVFMTEYLITALTINTEIVQLILFHGIDIFICYGLLALIYKTKNLFIYQIDYLIGLEEERKKSGRA